MVETAWSYVNAVGRLPRTDTNVTGQALTLTATNPDAMLIVASCSGAAMPHKAVVERGFKGKIYQTHAAATRDLDGFGGRGRGGIGGRYCSGVFV